MQDKVNICHHIDVYTHYHIDVYTHYHVDVYITQPTWFVIHDNLG